MEAAVKAELQMKYDRLRSTSKVPLDELERARLAELTQYNQTYTLLMRYLEEAREANRADVLISLDRPRDYAQRAWQHFLAYLAQRGLVHETRGSPSGLVHVRVTL